MSLNSALIDESIEQKEGIFNFFKPKDVVSMLCGIFGFASIIYAVNHEFTASSVFLIAATVADALDGKIARKFSHPTEYGKYIDTVNDVVAFGVAPAVFIYFYAPGYFSFALCAVLLSCGLMRLARYLCLEEKKIDYYLGVTITFNGLIIPLLYAVSEFFKFNFFFLVVLSSILMISGIRFRKISG